MHRSDGQLHGNFPVKAAFSFVSRSFFNQISGSGRNQFRLWFDEKFFVGITSFLKTLFLFVLSEKLMNS